MFSQAGKKDIFWENCVQPNWQHLLGLESSECSYQNTFSCKQNIPNTLTAEVFNDHFLSLAKTLTKTLQRCVCGGGGGGEDYQCSDELNKFCTKRLKFDDTFTIPEITAYEVGKYVSSVGSKNTSGCDGISNKIIMLSLPYIVQHLTYVYNLCINHSCFPSDLKTAKVVPLPKVKDLNDINNYRPISVLSSISKTLEKHVYKQLPQISWQIQLNPYTSVRISTTTLMSDSTYLSCWQATILHKWLKVEWCCLFRSQKSLWPYRPSDFIEKDENVSVKRQCHSVFLIIY